MFTAFTVFTHSGDEQREQNEHSTQSKYMRCGDETIGHYHIPSMPLMMRSLGMTLRLSLPKNTVT